jgi:sulfur carrier protein
MNPVLTQVRFNDFFRNCVPADRLQQPWASVHGPRDNRSMRLHMNGDAIALPDTPALTIAALLALQGLGERRVAVEVNGEIVPRGRHADYLLKENDVVEIVHALGGG